MRSRFVKLSGVLGLCLSGWATTAVAAPGYQYFVVGNPADVVTSTSGLLVLQGGGTDVDENFVRMGARAGGGDFVVIRASGTTPTTHISTSCARAIPWPPSFSRTGTRRSTTS